MLIKISNSCHAGCNHCMEHSTPKGEHMSAETFRDALFLTERLESLAWAAGLPRRILLSGGECTEHPRFFEFLDVIQELGADLRVLVLTNGWRFGDDEFRRRLLAHPSVERVQVTNDPSFYPKPLPEFPADPKITVVRKLTSLIHIGRHQKKSTPVGYADARAPKSFNLRSLTRYTGDVRLAVFGLRARATTGLSGNCTPTIDAQGVLRAGETNSCFEIGDVGSTAADVTARVLAMGSCDRCTLERTLTPAERTAIGL